MKLRHIPVEQVGVSRAHSSPPLDSRLSRVTPHCATHCPNIVKGPSSTVDFEAQKMRRAGNAGIVIADHRFSPQTQLGVGTIQSKARE